MLLIYDYQPLHLVAAHVSDLTVCLFLRFPQFRSVRTKADSLESCRDHYQRFKIIFGLSGRRWKIDLPLRKGNGHTNLFSLNTVLCLNPLCAHSVINVLCTSPQMSPEFFNAFWYVAKLPLRSTTVQLLWFFVLQFNVLLFAPDFFFVDLFQQSPIPSQACPMGVLIEWIFLQNLDFGNTWKTQRKIRCLSFLKVQTYDT